MNNLNMKNGRSDTPLPNSPVHLQSHDLFGRLDILGDKNFFQYL